MRRRLVVMVVATSSLILIALLLPMAWLIQRFAIEDALAAAGLEVQATESVVALRERADLVSFIQDINEGNEVSRTTVLFPDGDAIGPDPHPTADVLQARATGRAISNDTADGAEILVPVTLRGRPGAVGESSPAPVPEVPVIRVVIAGDRINADVVAAWAILAGLGIGLLALAVLVADRLGRTLVGPVQALAETAERIGHGDLEARAVPEGPPETREVGLALNRLATRIQELLAAERESVADASHRLRTPITALRLEAGELRDPVERERMTDGVDSLTRAVDGLIREARRPVREGLGATADAVATVAERTRFWGALAEEQQRPMRVELPAEPIPVKVAPDDLATAVDVLLENLFSHTAERVGFAVSVVRHGGAGASIVVSDDGPGFADLDAAVGRGRSGAGSTGLGLDIVRRTAEASGGGLRLENPDGGGARVVMTLGPPNEPPPP